MVQLHQVAQHLLSALAHLKKEREQVEQRIAEIEKMITRQGAAAKASRGQAPSAQPGPKKRGRPRKDAAPQAAAAPAKRGRPPGKKGGWTAAARAAARERMRKYWADRRKKGG